MADRKVTRLPSTIPALEDTEKAIFNADGAIISNRPPGFRWPVINGGNLFQSVTSFSRPSPVGIQVGLYRYNPANPTVEELVNIHAIAAGTWTHVENINIDVDPGWQLGCGWFLTAPIPEDADPAVGILTIARVAA